MKKEILKQLIKEEIRKVIEEEETAKKDSSEVAKLKDYLLNGAGKMSLKQINTKEELKAILNAISMGMNDTMKKNSIATKIFSIANSKL
tara:strand:- start:337 stop:603 length:267 start_codon:yes stop_codon:yes gene_type:complete